MNIIEYIVKNTNYNQAAIARKLGVSTTQITKWKQGEMIPFAREQELRSLAGLPDDYTAEWVLIGISQAAVPAWLAYFKDRNEWSEARSCWQIEEDPESYCPFILSDIAKLGVALPPTPPTFDDYGEIIDPTPARWAFHFLISQVVEGLCSFTDFLQVYVDKDPETSGERYYIDIEAQLPELALASIPDDLATEVGIDLAQMATLKAKTEQSVRDNLVNLCDSRIQAGLPITHDYFDLINTDLEDLLDYSVGQILRSQSTVFDCLPYAERRMITLLTSNAKALEALHVKIDLLLSQDQRGAS